MGTYVVTGAASGIGAATTRQLIEAGHRVIGVDRQQSDVTADLATPAGRRDAIDAITAELDVLDGVVTCAGMGGLPGRDGGVLAALNYFGSVEVIDGVRPLLVAAEQPAAVAIASNSVTATATMVSDELVAACVAGDEAAATRVGAEIGAMAAYPSSKAAICRWVRRNAITAEWIGSGITLNALAPGATETPMVEQTRADPIIGKHFDDFPIPSGAPAEPDQIAAAICFLLGPSARFFCGSVVFADGGTDALIRPDAY